MNCNWNEYPAEDLPFVVTSSQGRIAAFKQEKHARKFVRDRERECCPRSKGTYGSFHDVTCSNSITELT